MAPLVFLALVVLAEPARAPAAGDDVVASPAERDEERLGELERDNRKLQQRVQALEQTTADAERAEQEAAREAEVETLRAKNEALQADVEELRERQDRAEARLDREEFLSGRFHGYLDVGFFWVDGDGTGIRPDLNYVTTGLDNVAQDRWVFLGDPLSTAINSRGDVADTGDSQALGIDSIRSGGNPTFLVNAFNVAPSIGLGERVAVVGMVDFLPRGRSVATYGDTALSDYVDIKLAYVRWAPPTKRFGLYVYAGKIDSVFGREYRTQEAPDRITVTPSLMCRYTCGRPIGLGSRWSFLRRRQLLVNVSLTNGSTNQETFGTASDREHNAIKTLTARVAYEFPVGAGLEIGASGMGGAQDLQPRNDVFQWQYGIDAHLDIRGLEVAAEFIQGELMGRDLPGRPPCAASQCMDILSAYGLVGFRATPWFMPYVRTDWRDSRHLHGGVFYYESELIRFTPGARFEIDHHVIVKAEYTFNRELGRVPQFRNDVFTSSLVARF